MTILEQIRTLTGHGLHVNFSGGAGGSLFVEVFKPRNGMCAPFAWTLLLKENEVTDEQVLRWASETEKDFVRDHL
jgi:hypothetical protein